MSNIVKSQKFNPISVDKVTPNPFKQNTLTCQLRQVVETTTVYPGISVSTNMQDNIFGTNEFSGTGGKTYKTPETRIAWIPVPIGTTAQVVMNKLAAMPQAKIYKVLSNAPILTEQQKNAINKGITTLDKVAAKQVVRYPDNHAQAGQLIFDSNNNVQYKACYFSIEGKADEDRRGNGNVEVISSIQDEVATMLNTFSNGVNLLD